MNEIKILSDNPEIESKKIKFDFHAYKNTFVDIITGNQNEAPLVIGLEGRWGSGKTTLMKAIRSELQEYDKEGIQEGKRRCKSVWFQAWKYNDADNLFAALLEEIVQEMWRGNFLEKAEIAITTVWNKINLKAMPEFFANFTPFLKGIDKIIKEEDYKKNLPYFTLFSSFLKQLIGLWIHAEDSFKFKKEGDILPGEINDKKGVLVIFIDDLDRCDSKNIVKVLEATKLFLDFKGCIFVMGVSREIIVHALTESPHIGKEYANEYLEKMIQVSYELSIIHETDMKGYFKDIVSEFPEKEILIEYADVIVQSLGETPRKIKKFINNLNLQIKISEYKGLKEKLEVKDHIYWSVLKEAYREAFETIKLNPKIISMAKDEYKKYEEEIGSNNYENVEKIPYEPVKNILKETDLRNLVLKLPDNLEIIDTLIFESTAVGQNKMVLEAELPILKLEAYASGQMVKVGNGPFFYGEEKEENNIDYDYEIDVFPVTNEEYARFLNDKIPDEDSLSKLIDLEGSSEKVRCRIRKDGEKYTVEKGHKRHPVTSVSWYGANEYARWARKRLPTEEEWEKAARGPQGWEYPWGDKFEASLCNSGESGNKGTTEVDKYPKGKSYYGCYDMAGNVYEWTDSGNDEKKTAVLRGGAWSEKGDECRCALRSISFGGWRFDVMGFRCART